MSDTQAPDDRIQIELDDRERCDGLLVAARSLDITLRRTRLPAGDLFVAGRWRIERKTGPDFRRSLFDGRLFGQLVRLRHHPGIPLLVVEHAGRDGPCNRACTASALATVILDLDIPVVTTDGPWQTLRFARALASKATRTLRRPALGPRGIPAHAGPATRILLAIRGLGPNRAEALLRHFGSLVAIATATEEALAEVPGVGVKTARGLRRLFDMRTDDATKAEPWA